MLLQCFGDASARLWRCFGGALAMLRRCFGDASTMLRRCFDNASEMLRRCFGDASAMLRRCFNNASAMIIPDLNPQSLPHHHASCFQPCWEQRSRNRRTCCRRICFRSVHACPVRCLDASYSSRKDYPLGTSMPLVRLSRHRRQASPGPTCGTSTCNSERLHYWCHVSVGTRRPGVPSG